MVLDTFDVAARVISINASIDGLLLGDRDKVPGSMRDLLHGLRLSPATLFWVRYLTVRCRKRLVPRNGKHLTHVVHAVADLLRQRLPALTMLTMM